LFTGYTGFLDTNFASDAQLFATGSILDNKINSLSGYVTGITGTFGTLPISLASTGSILDNKINSLSGYVDFRDILFSGQIFNTGSRLDNKINALSGSAVLTYGNQNISGIKTFVDNTIFGDPSQGDFLVISGNTFTIYGSGNFTNGLFVSGVPVLTGLPNWYATSANLALTGSILNDKIQALSGYVNSQDIVFSGQTFNTGSRLDNKINSLSGYVNSQDNIFSGQTFNTGSRLDAKINSLSGYVNSQDTIFSGQIALTGSNLYNSIVFLSGLFTGYTGSLDANFASDAQLFITGSTLDNKINSLSGYLNSQDIIFSGQAFNTGSRLDNKINSLSGYTNSQNIIFSGQTASTGSILDNKINSLSGYINSQDNIFSGQIFNTGSRLDNKINALSGLFAGYTGSLDNTFATDAQLFSTGSTLDNKINSLSGYVNSQNIIFSGQTSNTGSRLDNKINSLSGYVDSKSITLPSTIVYTTGDQIISGNKTFINNIAVSGTGNFNNVKVSNIDKLFLSGIDIVITGNSSINIYNAIYISGNPVLTGIIPTSQTISNVVYTTGNQVISGNKNFYGDILLSGNNNRIGKLHYIETDNSFVYIKLEDGTQIFSSEEASLYGLNGLPSVRFDSRVLTDGNYESINWNERYLANQLGTVLTWTGNNIGIGTNTPSEKLTVAGNIKIFDGGNGLYIYDSLNSADNQMIWLDGELIFANNYDVNSPNRSEAGFIFNQGPLGENSLYSLKIGDQNLTYLHIPSGRQGYIAVNSDLVNTGIILNNKINALSGYINSQDNVFSGQIFNTGSRLDTKINSLSGYVNSQDIIFSGQTFNTGSRLDNKINSLSGYVNSQDIIFSGQIASSGSSLYNSIIALSGLFTGYTGSLDANFATDIQLFNTGSVLDNKINSLSGYVNSQDTLFSGQTFNTGSRLDNKINSLSGYVNAQDILFSGQIASTGSNLDNKINLISGFFNNNVVYTTGNQTVLGQKTFSGTTTVIGHFAATSKSFLIDHPLDNNKKLQYASLEGPEHGVFLRGKTNENIITLPNYWSALVNENSISVNLTPINVYSNIYVVDYNNTRVITNGNNGNYYFYTVYGERKDIPKLTVEF
jgi:Na+-transporting NADH:ubiquinone oxidoreductase subunit NqrA